MLKSWEQGWGDERQAASQQTVQTNSLVPLLLRLLVAAAAVVAEGLAVGVGFGSIGRAESATLAGAWALAIGIAIQVWWSE